MESRLKWKNICILILYESILWNWFSSAKGQDTNKPEQKTAWCELYIITPNWNNKWKLIHSAIRVRQWLYNYWNGGCYLPEPWVNHQFLWDTCSPIFSFLCSMHSPKAYSQSCLMWPSKRTVKYGHIRQVVA